MPLTRSRHLRLVTYMNAILPDPAKVALEMATANRRRELLLQIAEFEWQRDDLNVKLDKAQHELDLLKP